jgi:hypothetical protein
MPTIAHNAKILSLIIAGLASHLLPKALKVAGGKIEIAHEQLQQYEKEGGSKAILAKVASPCLGVLKKVIPTASEKEVHEALSEGGTKLKEFLSAILNDDTKNKEFEDNLQKFLTRGYDSFEEFQRNVKETMGSVRQVSYRGIFAIWQHYLQQGYPKQDS